MTRKIALIMAAVVLLVSPMAGNGQAAIAGLANNQWPDVQSVAVGQDHSCALTAYGGVKCWGSNSSGQLGDGMVSGFWQLKPVDVSGLRRGVTALVSGIGHTCALTESGGVKCWGSNSSGQLGDGTKDNRRTPVDVVGLTSGVIALAAGGESTCAVTSSGEARCWGDDQLTPAEVSGLTSEVKGLTAGLFHKCALTASGGVKCWGENGSGQLGDGTTERRTTAVDVIGLASGVKALTAGIFHTCALMESGDAKCWGLNFVGALGDGTTESRLTPVAVSGLDSKVVALAAGGDHTCALTIEGGIKCWGDNGLGQLGDGTTINRSKPVDASGLTSGIAALATGNNHNCAATAIGGAKCWGQNSYGKLGNWNNTDSLIAVDVIFSSIIYLPITAQNLCPDFLDDFNYPSSGWETGEDEGALVEYNNGEYRTLIKRAGAVYGFAAPTFKRQDYVVEVDARWEGNSGASYGLIFGMVGDFEKFYSFEVNSDSQVLATFRYDGSGWTTLVPIRYTDSIHSGNASNHLKITRRGSSFNMEVNGRNEGTWGDGIMTNETEVGLIASAYSDLPNADARFDNFKVSCLTQGEPWAVTSAPGATANIGPDLIPVNGWADRLTGPAWLRRLPGLDVWR